MCGPRGFWCGTEGVGGTKGFRCGTKGGWNKEVFGVEPSGFWCGTEGRVELRGPIDCLFLWNLKFL